MSDLKITVSNWGEVALDKKGLRALMRGAANDIRSKTARLINQSQGSGQSYRGGGGSQYRGQYHAGHYLASAPGDPPTRVTGTLRASLKSYVWPTGEGFAVRARAFYALFLETGARGGGNPYGGRSRAAAQARATGRRRRSGRGRYQTRVLEPRPFLDRVMDEQASELERRTRDALGKGLTWKQTK